MNWKGQILHLLVLWALPLVATATLLLFFRRSWPHRVDMGRLPLKFGLAFLVSRIGYMLFLYSLPGFSGGGDFHFYLSLATRTLDGEIPGRDFSNLYGPLFPFLPAFGLWMSPGGHPAGVLVSYILADFAVVFLGWKLSVRILGSLKGAWVGAWLVVSPLLWHQVIVRAADESIFLGTLLGAVFLFERGRCVLASVVLGLGFCATKVTYGPYAAAVLATMWFHGRGRVAGLLVFLGTCGLIFGGYMAMGGDPLQVTGYGGEVLWSGNLSSLTALLPAPIGRAVGIAAYGVLTIGTAIWVARLGLPGSVAWKAALALSAVHSVSMLVQPFVTVNWICQALAFLIVVLGAAREVPLARLLLWVLPVLGFFICVTDDTRQPLYQWVATPLSLLFHAGLLLLIVRGIPEPTVVGPGDPIP